jgi:hypothetical protein
LNRNGREGQLSAHNSKEATMKKEDVWMVGLVVFTLIWVALFGLGVMG